MLQLLQIWKIDQERYYLFFHRYNIGFLMIIRIKIIFIYIIIGLLINNCSSIKDLSFLNFADSSEEEILEGKRIDISTSSKKN